jgi:hypothetical protein
MDLGAFRVGAARAAVPGAMFGLVAGVLGWCGPAAAQPLMANFASPALDRWMYPFNSTPGAEFTAPVFAALLQPGFDDRDAQNLVGFDTSTQIPTGLAPSAYRLSSVRLVATVANDVEWAYDGTFDSVTTSYAEGDPERTTDADAGKPVELFGAGYRAGWTAQTFRESSAFSTLPPVVQPAEGCRNVFAAVFDSVGAATDTSRQVRQRFEAPPMAVGRNPALTPGQPVPVNSTLTFDVNLCDAAARAYIQRALSEGVLNLVVTSLSPATGGPGGGSGEYPRLYTREHPLGAGRTVTLSITARLGPAADVTGDGQVNVQDFLAFLQLFAAADPGADFTGDCTVNVADFLAYLQAYAAG